MSVYQTSRGKWMADVEYRDLEGRIQRVRRTAKVQTRRGAERLERELRASLESGEYGRAARRERRTFAEVAAEHEEASRATCRESTIGVRRELLRLHILPELGKVEVTEIDTRTLDRFVAGKLAGGLSRAYVGQMVATIRAIIRTAHEWGLVERLPRFPAVTVPEGRTDFLSFEEADRLVAAASGQDRCMVLLALRTGMRAGELRGLEWGAVDLVARKLVVTRAEYRGQVGAPKGGRSREIPLTEDAVEALRGQRRPGVEAVFSRPDGSGLTVDDQVTMMRRCCRQAGVRAVKMHCLRHTFASHLVMKGAPLKAVQELLGHATITMTMRYAHLSPESRRDAVDLLAAGRQPDGNGLPITAQVRER